LSGTLIILVTLLMPGGIYGAWLKLLSRKRGREVQTTQVREQGV
jgi:hypothetical protein